MTQLVQSDNLAQLSEPQFGKETQAGGEKSNSGIQAIGVNPTSLIFQIINFIVLFILLKKFLFTPVLRYLEQRRVTIEKSLKSAKEMEKQREDFETEKQKLLEEANKKTDTIIAAAKADAQKQRQDGVAKTQAEQKKIIENTKKEIEAYKQTMVAQAKKDIASLVLETTKKVIGKALDKKGDQQLISQTIKELK